MTLNQELEIVGFMNSGLAPLWEHECIMSAIISLEHPETEPL